MRQSMFRTPEGEDRYFAAYDAALALWPVPVSTRMVETRFGPTHVNICGPKEAPALLLLHGSAISSTMWYPNVAALSGSYRVYAPDIIGEMGKSIRTRPTETPESYMDWLIELVDGLQLNQMSVVGISFGGYLAIQLANAAPQRIAKLILLSPAALLPTRLRFYLRMLAAILLPFLPLRTRQALFLGMASETAAPIIQQLMTPTDFQYKMFIPKVISDEDLMKIQAATLLLIGERELIYNPSAAVQRATRLIPHIETEIISCAGHAANLDQPEIVNQRVLKFLAAA